MSYLYHDKLEKVVYCKTKQDSKKFYFYMSNNYYIVKLKTDKPLTNDYTIATRDRRMIELLGYWLNDSNLNLDNIYMLIRLKAINNNKDFIHWWIKYNFTIEIERTVV